MPCVEPIKLQSTLFEKMMIMIVFYGLRGKKRTKSMNNYGEIEHTTIMLVMIRMIRMMMMIKITILVITITLIMILYIS